MEANGDVCKMDGDVGLGARMASARLLAIETGSEARLHGSGTENHVRQDCLTAVVVETIGWRGRDWETKGRQWLGGEGGGGKATKAE